MKRVLAAVGVLSIALILLPSVILSQSKQEGIRLFREASTLQDRARTRQEMEKAVQKYEQALQIFKQVGELAGEGKTLGNLGNVYHDWGQYSQAAEYFEQARQIFRQVGDVASEGMALGNLGLVYSDWGGQYSKAVGYYEKSLEIARKVGDVRAEANALGNLGDVYHTWGDNSKSVEYYEKSLRIKKRIGDFQGEARTLNSLGYVYKALGEYKRAVDHYEKSLHIAEKIGDARAEGNALGSLGNVYADWGQYPKAVEYYEKSLELAKQVGNVKGVGSTLNNLGLVYGAWGQYAKAVEYYERALEITKRIGDVQREGQALNNLGNVYLGWGQYAKAVEYYEKDLAICRELGDVRGEGGALGNLGNVYKDWSQHSRAVEYYEKSLEIAKKVGDVRGEGKTLGNLGTVYREWGEHSKAVEYYEKDLAICRELGDVRGEGGALGNLGNVYKDWGQYTKAVEYYEKSLEIGKKIGDVEGEGAALNNLGIVYDNWGQRAKAMEYYEKSLEIAKKLGDVRGEGHGLMNLGTVYQNWDQYAKAVEYYEKSLEIAKKIGNVQGEGDNLMNLGTVYADWGRYAKAVECYEKDLAICRELGDVRGQGQTLNNLGNIYKDWGQYGKAVGHYEKSLEIARKMKDPKAEANALNNLGLVLQHRGEYKSALENFQKGLAILTEIKVPANGPKALIAGTYMDTGDLDRAEPLLKDANSNTSWGRFYLLKLDYPRAKEYYGKIVKSSEQNRDVHDLFTAYTGLGMAHEDTNDNTKALEYFRKAVQDTEDLRATLSPAERETFFDVRIGGFYRTAPYEGLARVLLKLNQPMEAFKESEYTRARIFAEAISKRTEYAGLDVPKGVRDKDALLTDELAALTKNLQKGYEKQNKEVIASLEPQVKEAKEKLAAHVNMLRKEYPLFAATKYPQPMDLSQTALTDNEWVLAYHVTDTGIIIYLTRGKNLVKGLFKPIPRKDVDDLVRKFRQPMELGSDDSVQKKLAAFDFLSGKKLSDLLLADILPDLPKNTPLIIVPDGSLGVVPFEMLILNDGGKVTTDKRPQTSGAEFFGDRNPISYYQSITALTLARTLGKHQKPGEKLLAMVDPVFSSDDPRLVKLAKHEKDKLLASLPTDLTMSIQSEKGISFPRLPLTAQLGESLKKTDPKTDLYEGMTAKKSVIVDKDLTPYRSVVFATHGYFGKDLPGIQEPVLVLSLVGEPKGKDGFLRLSEVMGLKINCDIAALTACQTGLGRVISGEGTMGMGRAFQYAGAKSVLMSLWSVSETSSVQLVESFFRHLKGGKNKLEALKEAREEIRKAGYDHPFYWAPFILVGEVN